MRKYEVAWLPGDGTGVDVLEAVKVVLDHISFDADYVHADIGWEFWRAEGDPLPKRTAQILHNVDVAMFGAITSKPAAVANDELDPKLLEKGFVYRSPIVRLRQEFDLYTSLRPCKAYPGNSLNFKEGIDLVIFRENTEDLYAGVEFATPPQDVIDALTKHSPQFAPFAKLEPTEYAISTKINTRAGCDRIIRSAFEFARLHKRKKVTIVHKANVVRATDGLFLETGKKIAQEFPEIEVDDANIDAMCMWLLKNPFNYDVLVAPNLYGDIISDLGAQMVGGLGFGCSGNIGDNLAVFEPTHGSAPKYAGQYKVNPIAAILAAKMMLDWLGEADLAVAVENAVAEVINEGAIKTYDMGGSHTTLEMGQAIAGKL
jgi:isocitrate/isopropylmalate dehydrogenase